MGIVAATALGPAVPKVFSKKVMLLTAATAVMGLLIRMTVFPYALQGSITGIIASLSTTSPVIILPLLWLCTGQRPSALSSCGAALAGLAVAGLAVAGLAVAGLALIFLR